MDVVYPRCAGLDVHKDTVVACIRVTEKDQVRRDVRTFATSTAGLLALSDWLSSQGCRQVAMEATGVYWKPVWHILSDGEFELVLANAAHIKNVPGRKTDVNDAAWIADLLAHGLIRASFVPEPPIQELRSLMRTRKQLVREQSSHVQRLQKTLEDANIKLDGVISDILGVSGRAMVEALIAGETDPGRLADLAHRRLRAAPDKLREALHGRVTKNHRFLLRLHLGQIDSHAADIDEIDQQVEEHIRPFRAQVRLLTTIPGIMDVAARTIIGEIGIDMSRFPTAGHLLSWAGLCPRNDESAGKRRSARLRKGDPWLKATLIQCAWAASRKEGCYYQAQFRRLKTRHGPKKAVCAVAASLLTAIYHMLKDGTEFTDLGADHFQRRSKAATVIRLTRQLQNLGYAVQISEIPEAA
jgi:transposase